MVSDSLYEILRCPLHTHGPPFDKVDAKGSSLSAKESVYTGLMCRECGSMYPIIEGIPDMIVRNPSELSFLDNEIKQWDEHTKVYDEHRIRDPIYMACVDAAVKYLNPRRGEFVLDAASSTGLTIRKYYKLGI